MTDLVGIKNLIMKFSLIENSETAWNPEGVKGCDEETFFKNNPTANKSIFSQLDIDKDGYITEDEFNRTLGMDTDEDGTVTDKERNDAFMMQYKFFARRDIDKWFKVDRNRDGVGSNVEWKAWETYNRNGKYLEGALSNEQLSQKYNMPEVNEDDLTNWINYNIRDFKEDAKNRYGIELSEAQIVELKKEMIEQLNTWLFKEGDNEKSSFYQQLNLDAYTRLMSTVDGEACCGGDICEFSGFSPSNLEKNGKYTAEEMKARLNWAENSYLVDDDGKTVYDKNGQTIPAKMMTPEQVQKYKEIVETVTGQPWDSDGWEVSEKQWHEIGERVNGTYGDNTRLKGKTRADVPENRQALLRFLEEKGWLYEQFK